MKHLRLLLCACAALCGPLSAFAQFVTQDYVPMRFIQVDPAIYPMRLLSEGITSGTATVAVQVDDGGRLTDTLVIGYSHPEFADAALVAVKAWTYRPAMIRGFPRSATAVLNFRFKAGQVFVDLSISSAAAMVHFRVAPDSGAYSVCTLDQLDRIPTPTKIVRPTYTPEQAAHSHVRHVAVDFYIDEQGHVRLPAVSRDTNLADEELSAAAVTAVSQWQFEPPVSKGQPVIVLAQQDFSFK
jgi:TonB family protein